MSVSKNSVTPRKRSRWTKDDTQLTLLGLPTIIWFLLFNFAPMFGIIIAFKNYTVSGKGFIGNMLASPWCGLKNFRFMFINKDIWIIIRNTLLYNILFIILGFVVPVTLAILIGQLHNRRSGKVYQTMMFLPYFLSWVVVSTVVFGFLSPDKGLVNNIIEMLGGQTKMWYMEPKYWPFFLTFMNLWKGTGYSMVVYLATITGIDGTFYEAAVIDGATKWQQVRFITLPMLKTVIIIMFIMNVGRIFYSDFGLFYQVPRNSNSLFNVTQTFDVYVFNMLKTGTTGNASAAAFLQSICGCITILTTNAIVRKVDSDSALI